MPLLFSTPSSFQRLIADDLITFDERVRKRRTQAIKMVYADVGGKKGDLIVKRYNQGKGDSFQYMEGAAEDPRHGDIADEGGADDGIFRAPPGPIGEAMEASQAQDGSRGVSAVGVSVNATTETVPPSMSNGETKQHSQPTTGASVLLEAPFRSVTAQPTDISKSASAGQSGRTHVQPMPQSGMASRQSSTTWSGAPFPQGVGNTSTQVGSNRRLF